MSTLREAIGNLLDGFDAEIARRASELSRPKGGQSCGPGGDFANIMPSALGRLRWWSRAFREALAQPEEPPRVSVEQPYQRAIKSWIGRGETDVTPSPSPDYVRGQEAMRERAAEVVELDPRLWYVRDAPAAIRSLPLEDAGEAPAAQTTPEPSPAPGGEGLSANDERALAEWLETPQDQNAPIGAPPPDAGHNEGEG